MKTFLNEDFLLQSDTAKELYHQHAENMPIYDYHCHLSPKDIYEDRIFESITDLWLVDGKAGDHYKWRALRGNGVDEKFITGDASKREKFREWAKTIPYTLGNPLYHWTHLEMKRYFGIEETLSGDNADRIYDLMNEKLKTLSARKIIESSHVDTLCTTDDPIDDLRYHKLMREDKTMKFKVYPAFRPDKVVNIHLSSFTDYIASLEKVLNHPVKDLTELLDGLKERIEYFQNNGCRIADHGLDDEVPYEETTFEEVNQIFQKALRKEILTHQEERAYRSYLLTFFGKEYAKRGWVLQYHIKAMRNNNSIAMRNLGPDTGYDSMSDLPIAHSLSRLLDSMEREKLLPKTILYSLDPGDYEILTTLAYCFQGGRPGKIQLGSGWWFLDQKDGMQKQLTALSNLGLLSRFVGMLTDSRSLLSYTRHEYFRRVLCNYIGGLVENGEYPNDMKFLGKVVEDICFNNAKSYFDEDR